MSQSKKLQWIASPPLVPELAAIDAVHLERMTLGERELEREVLSLFARQCREIREQLAEGVQHPMVLAHKLKGSARGIGAFAVADAAERLERLSRAGRSVAPAVASLERAIDDALAAIVERLKG